MQTSRRHAWSAGTLRRNPHRGQWRIHGRHTPGRVVMVIQEGACWVRRDDGSREDLTAKSVVIWERLRNTNGMAAPAAAA